MKKHQLFQALAACLLPALLLSGCWQEDLPEEEISVQQPEQLETETSAAVLPTVFSLPYAPNQSLDPLTCPEGMQQVVASLLCEGLFRLGPDLEPEPWLCERYTYDAETYTYTLTLRSGVTFSDGSALTAADVKTTLERAKATARYGARLAALTHVKAEDSSTVILTLSGSNTGLPALLDIPIVKAGTESAPIGTGPYCLSTDENGASLTASPTWWRGAEQPVERIALVEANDQDTMLYRFSSHEVQLVTTDLTGTSSVSLTGSVDYLDADTTILQYIGCNVSSGALSSAALRRSLSEGIDRDQLVSGFLSGHGTAAQFPVSPVSPLYPASLESAYSASSLAAALAELGGSQPLTLLVNDENSFKVSIAAQIAEAFTAAGLPVTVRSLPWEEYTAALTAGDFDLYYGEVKLTADWDLRPLLGTGGALNYGGWADTQTDQLLSAFSAASDRVAAMEDLCAYLQEQAPILPICFKSTTVLLQADVIEGLVPTESEPFYDLSSCSFHLQGE